MSNQEPIPFLSLAASSKELRARLLEVVETVVDSGHYVLGPELQSFEREIAQAFGMRSAVGVGNGTDAIELALRAIGVEPGDQVLVPAATAIATWLGVTRMGAIPIGVDVEAEGWGMSVDRAAAAITPKTRALIAVHLYGRPAEADRLARLAVERGIDLVEDCAQAHLATFDGSPVGTFGRAATTSFYPTKNLGALGDAGAVVSNDTGLVDRVRMLRNLGWRERDWSEVKGVNSRLDEIQAAILRVKLRSLATWNQTRRDLAREYLTELKDVPGLCLPMPADGHVWHLFVVRHSQRDELRAALTARGVGTSIHYSVPPHLTEAFRADGWTEGDFPVAEQLSSTALSLPLHPHLDAASQSRVIAAVKEVCASLK